MKQNFPPDFPKSKSKAPLIIAIVAACLLLFGALIVFGLSMFRDSDANKAAENYLRNNAEVQQVTGGIKDFGMIPTGNINVSNGHGHADLTISVNAYKNDIDARVILEKQPGAEWQVVEMEIIDND